MQANPETTVSRDEPDTRRSFTIRMSEALWLELKMYSLRARIDMQAIVAEAVQSYLNEKAVSAGGKG